MQVDPRFRSVADRFFRMFQSPGPGRALAVYLHGERALPPGRHSRSGSEPSDGQIARDEVAAGFTGT